MHTQTLTGKARDAGNPVHNQHRHTHLSALRQSRPESLQLASVSSATAAPQRPPLSAMTPGQARAWLGSMRERLEKKMVRERAYLDRRAARGTHTPTDDAYAEDQRLETELIDLLNEVVQHV